MITTQNPVTKRLSKDTDYKRPKSTIQDKLSADEIQEKLEDYIEVEDISKVPLNTHLRYFTIVTEPKKKTSKKMFRLGGFLSNKNEYEKYVILSNGKNSWSVNTKTSIFYRKMGVEEIKESYKDEVDELNELVGKKNKEIKKLKKELDKLKK